MSVSIHEVLDGLRGSALDERDKGDKFARLVLSLLRTEPEWVNRFSDVGSGRSGPGDRRRHGLVQGSDRAAGTRRPSRRLQLSRNGLSSQAGMLACIMFQSVTI